MKIRVVIVDDEPLARERIRTLLAGQTAFEILGECANGAAAVDAIRQHAPDLLFLDVQMPGMDGFEVLRSLDPKIVPEVIFVTAYDKHALAAFEVHALDYLLKPFKPARFLEAVERARERIQNRTSGDLNERLRSLIEACRPASAHSNRLAVKTADRIIFLKTGQIDWIEAAGNYAVLHVGKDTHIMRETLGALESRLDPAQFLRVSRSALVNVEQIKELQPLFKGEYQVVLHNGQQLAMTRGIREVQALLRII